MKDQSITSRGLTKDTGWQIGVRRTIPAQADDVWDLLLSPDGLKIWLGDGEQFPFKKGSGYKLRDGTLGEVKIYQPGSHWRITRKPPDPTYQRPSTIQIRVIGKGDRCVLAFHEEHLPDERARQSRKSFYLGVIEKINDIMQKS
jgi:uncharacterized protein YndB with AHSA1/START domain